MYRSPAGAGMAIALRAAGWQTGTEGPQGAAAASQAGPRMGRKQPDAETEVKVEDGRTRTLTVSYGAFSCTLTGYKHPEAIVQALSDHFRMIAEQSPQFALPPPQVDMALLQQIAAQEMRRQMDEGTLDLATVAELAGSPLREVRPAEDAEVATDEPPPSGAEPHESPSERSARRRAAAIANLRAAVAAAAAAAQAGRSRPDAEPGAEPGEAEAPDSSPEPARTDAALFASTGPVELTPQDAIAAPSEPRGEAAPPDPLEMRSARLPVLRLVPDLRADGAGTDSTAPSAAPAAVGGVGFADYASRAGADTLSELIEAAAAYLTVIEGRRSFEAAAVVGLVARHPPADGPSDALGRADAFAALVASGRLRRVEGNRYTLAAPELGRSSA